MGVKNLIFMLLLIPLSCLFSSSVDATDHAAPPHSSQIEAKNQAAAAPHSSSGPFASQPTSSSSRFFMTAEQDQKTIDELKANPTLKKLCSNKDHPKVCINTLMPFVMANNDPKIRPAMVLKISVKLTYDKAKKAIALAEKLYNGPSTDSNPVYKSCLETCMKSYRDVLKSCRNTLDAVEAHDFFTINGELSNKIINVDVCEDAFVKAGIKSPLARTNEVLGNMAANNLSFGVDLVRA